MCSTRRFLRLLLVVSLAAGFSSLSFAGVEITPAGGFKIEWDGNDGDHFDPIEPPDGAQAPDNLALASNGGVHFASAANSLHFPPHDVVNLNDGFYGNTDSHINGQGPGPGNMGVILAQTQLITGFAFGRDNGNGEFDSSSPGTDCCGGQLRDRVLGLYSIEITADGGSSWTEVGTLNYDADDIDDVPGDLFTPWFRHQYSLTDDTGGAVAAYWIRITVPDLGTAIDEIEVYGIQAVMQLAEEGGVLAEANIAPSGTPFAKDLINDGGFAAHQIAHINDGIFGNSNSWIGNSEGSFVGIAFAEAFEFQSLAFGRDNGGEAQEFTDRSVGTYVVQFTEALNPDENTPDEEWDTLDTLDYSRAGGLLSKPHLRHRYNFEQIEATGIRIITFNGACIDEIEIYAQPGEVQTPLPTLRPVLEGGEFVANNLAEGATPFTNGDLGPDLGIAFHIAANLNDLIYGNSNSWIGNSPTPFGGINLGATAVTVQSFAFGRDNLGSFPDRNQGTYTVQTTTVANPDETTPDESWETIGLIIYSGAGPANPALRHAFNMSAPVEITGLRLLTPAGAAIDELEIYADPLIVIPPPPEALEITPGEGFEITWDGNDGDHFDPTPPEDGAKVPDNLALAANGAEPFASDEFGDIHVIENINDGFYGNANSWIDGGANPAFSGVRFGSSVEMNRIAWGRDNGNGEWDDSDVGTDRCGGQCDDRDSGVYTLQFTTVANPDEATDDADWTTIGEFNYKFSNDIEPGGEFTSHLRHEYVVATAGGGAISATAIRMIQPNGNAIDEIEVYGVARDPYLAFDDGDEVSFTFNNLDSQFIGFDFENRGAGQ